MTRHGSGLVCMPVMARRLDELGIAPMVDHNTSRLGTAFSVSIDAKDLVTTGASAYDRAATVRKVLDPAARAADFSMPGHTFPLRCRGWRPHPCWANRSRRRPGNPGWTFSCWRDH